MALHLLHRGKPASERPRPARRACRARPCWNHGDPSSPHPPVLVGAVPMVEDHQRQRTAERRTGRPKRHVRLDEFRACRVRSRSKSSRAADMLQTPGHCPTSCCRAAPPDPLCSTTPRSKAKPKRSGYHGSPGLPPAGRHQTAHDSGEEQGSQAAREFRLPGPKEGQRPQGWPPAHCLPALSGGLSRRARLKVNPAILGRRRISPATTAPV